MRHGRTAWNRVGRAQGHADVELDEVGHAQAAAAAPYLASLPPAALWCSDLTRARQTCAYVEGRSGLSATYDPRLREFDVGERQGLTMPEFADAFPDAHEAWERGGRSFELVGGESVAAVAERIVPALRECLGALAPGETGVVVTHGAALRVGLLGLLGWPPDHDAGIRAMDNCAWATVEELTPGGTVRLVGYNESVRPGHDAPRTLDADT
jgi:probable phosphoglycerate mutase